MKLLIASDWHTSSIIALATINPREATMQGAMPRPFGYVAWHDPAALIPNRFAEGVALPTHFGVPPDGLKSDNAQ